MTNIQILDILIISASNKQKLENYLNIFQDNNTKLNQTDAIEYLTILSEFQNKLINAYNKVFKDNKPAIVTEAITHENMLDSIQSLSQGYKQLIRVFHTDRLETLSTKLQDLDKDQLKNILTDIAKILNNHNQFINVGYLNRINVDYKSSNKQVYNLLRIKNIKIYQQLKDSIILGSKKPFRYKILFSIISIIPIIGLPIVNFVLHKLIENNESIKDLPYDPRYPIEKMPVYSSLYLKRLWAKNKYEVFNKETSSFIDKYYGGNFLFSMHIGSIIAFTISIILISFPFIIPELLLIIPAMSLIFSPMVFLMSSFTHSINCEMIGFMLAERKANYVINKILRHEKLRKYDESYDYKKLYNKINALITNNEGLTLFFNSNDSDYITKLKFNTTDTYISLNPTFAPYGTNTPSDEIVKLCFVEQLETKRKEEHKASLIQSSQV